MRATVLELGDGNAGSFGPTTTIIRDFDSFVHEITRPEYFRAASRRIACIDGRPDIQAATNVSDFAPTQVPGSWPVFQSAIDLMSTDCSNTLSELLNQHTRMAIEAGYEVVVHGDDHTAKNGCAANARLRDVLHKNLALQDELVPVVQALLQAINLQSVVHDDDIRKAIRTGKARASDELVWDVTPAQAVDVMCAHGAGYQTLHGEHQERTVVITLNGTYDSQAFADDHKQPGNKRDELFVFAAGEWIKLNAAIKGYATETANRALALDTMRGFVYAVGLAKQIGNRDLRLVLVRG